MRRHYPRAKGDGNPEPAAARCQLVESSAFRFRTLPASDRLRAVSNTLYDRDFHAWANEQAALLRDGKLDHADIDNIAKEIESMGRSEKRQLISRLSVLLVYLLKWQYQPKRRGRSLQRTIEQQRYRLERHLGEDPSLKSQWDTAIHEAYMDARYDTEKETDIDRDTFPAERPFTFDQMMDEGFWPDWSLPKPRQERLHRRVERLGLVQVGRVPGVRNDDLPCTRDLPRDVIHRRQERGVVGADQHQRRHPDRRQGVDHLRVLLRQHPPRRARQSQRAAVLAHADLVAAAERRESLGLQVIAALARALVPCVPRFVLFEARAGVE